MGKCVIFCAAEFDQLLEPVVSADYILAADGGLRHLEKLNLKPQGILGDFDSLGYVPVGAEVFPVERLKIFTRLPAFPSRRPLPICSHIQR